MRLIFACLLFFAVVAFDVEGESTASVSVTKDGKETSMTVNGDGMVGASIAENSDGSIDASTVNDGVASRIAFPARVSSSRTVFGCSLLGLISIVSTLI